MDYFSVQIDKNVRYMTDHQHFEIQIFFKNLLDQKQMSKGTLLN